MATLIIGLQYVVITWYDISNGTVQQKTTPKMHIKNSLKI